MLIALKLGVGAGAGAGGAGGAAAANGGPNGYANFNSGEAINNEGLAM